MNFLNLVKQQLRTKELVPRIFKTKHSFKQVQSEEHQLEEAITFFNRITQQVNLMELSKNIQNVQSEVFDTQDSKYRVQKYIPIATSSAVERVDPVYLLEGIQDKLLTYELETTPNLNQKVELLKNTKTVVEDEIQNILQNNHQFIYKTFISVQNYYKQLSDLSSSTASLRNHLKLSQLPIVSRTNSIRQKLLKLKTIQNKLELLGRMSDTVGSLYNKRHPFYQQLLSVNNILKKIQKNNNYLIQKVNCLKNIKNNCLQFLRNSHSNFVLLVKQSIFQKYSSVGIMDSILSNYLLNCLFLMQQSKFDRVFQEHLSTIYKFVDAPEQVQNIKEYLQIIYKYLSNLNHSKVCINSIKTKDLQNMLINIQNSKIPQFFRQIRTWVDKTLETFYLKTYQRLGSVCVQVISRGSKDDKRVIKKFIQMVNLDHCSEGFGTFKTRIKGSLLKQ